MAWVPPGGHPLAIWPGNWEGGGGVMGFHESIGVTGQLS